MTSWLKQGPAKKKEEVEKHFLFETSDTGFCAQFNAYLYAALYSEVEHIPLMVNDTVNAVSIRYPLIRNTFQPIPSISFTDTNLLTAISLKKRRALLMNSISAMKSVVMRNFGRELFQWNPSVVQTPTLDVSGIDVGVHLRTFQSNEGKNPTIEQYIKAIQSYQKTSKKTTLRVFVMTDSSQRLEELIRKKDPSWTLKTISNPTNITGHSQRDFNASPSRIRMNAYMEFLAELQAMQKIPTIICTFSSNVGKFLYLSTSNATNIVSIDEPAFAAF